jgi:hypothetical protein
MCQLIEAGGGEKGGGIYESVHYANTSINILNPSTTKVNLSCSLPRSSVTGAQYVDFPG